jgi:hypothetical protein
MSNNSSEACSLQQVAILRKGVDVAFWSKDEELQGNHQGSLVSATSVIADISADNNQAILPQG